MIDRKKIFEVINEERDYQDEKWGPNGTEHSICEFLVYIRDYVEEALHICSREYDTKALDAVRKVTALGVVCMEKHGAPRRGD
jgi:hypothetical protein